MGSVKNMKHKTAAIFLIVGLALFLASISPVNAADITISGNEVIVIDSDYTQTGNILIQDSGTLIVKNGATLTASGYDITVNDRGTLIVNNGATLEASRITVNDHATLKIEKGVLIANILILYDDAKLEMTKNSNLRSKSGLLANNRTSITLKNSGISTSCWSGNCFDATCNRIELSSARIRSERSISIDVQSFSISNSTITSHWSSNKVSIKSRSDVSILKSAISGYTSIDCPTLSISDSTIKGCTVSSQLLTAANTNFEEGLTIENGTAYLTSVTCASTFPASRKFYAKGNATIYSYLYLTAKITDKLGNPISDAKVDVLYYLNETTYKSETTDSNGNAKLLVLSDIITSQKDEFIGNYKVIACYQNYTTAKEGVQMKNNKDISLEFTDLSIKPASGFEPSPSNEPPNNSIISILVYLIVLIAAVSFIILWVRKHKPPTDKDKLEILKPIKSKLSTATPIYNIEEVGRYAECPYCGINIRDTFFEHGGIVRCNKCGAFHHKECFEFYGGKCGSSSCKLREA